MGANDATGLDVAPLARVQVVQHPLLARVPDHHGDRRDEQDENDDEENDGRDNEDAGHDDFRSVRAFPSNKCNIIGSGPKRRYFVGVSESGVSESYLGEVWEPDV